MQVHIADRDPDTGCRGYSIGMLEAQRRFLIEPTPALVLGLESRATIVERGFEAFLELPLVRYLELPFTNDEFRQAAASLRRVKLDVAAMEDVRRLVTAHSLENIRRNVSHRLNGVVLVALNQAVAAIRRVAKTADSTTKNAQDALASSTTSLMSSDSKVWESLAVFDKEIRLLDGICAQEMSEILHIQRESLGMAADDLSRFVIGITGWSRGERGDKSLKELADIGEGVIRTFRDAVSVFTRLASGTGGVAG